MLVESPHNKTALDILENVRAASLLIGVARAWELVGARDTGLFASLAALSGRDRTTHQSEGHSSATSSDPRVD
jgi:hypothetical protein